MTIRELCAQLGELIELGDGELPMLLADAELGQRKATPGWWFSCRHGHAFYIHPPLPTPPLQDCPDKYTVATLAERLRGLADAGYSDAPVQMRDGEPVVAAHLHETDPREEEVRWRWHLVITDRGQDDD